MELLKGISNLFANKRLRKIELLSNELGKKSQSMRLYRLLKDPIIKTDYDLAFRLFKKKPDVRYRLLKKRTQDLLLNQLFFLDTERLNFSPRLQKLNECSRNLHAFRMLLHSGEIKAGKSLAKRTLTQSIRYQLWDISLPLLKYLRFISSFSLDSKVYVFYNDQRLKIFQIQQDELLAEDLRLTLEMRSRIAGANPGSIAKKAMQNAEEIQSLDSFKDSFNIKFDYLKLRIYSHTLKDDYDNADQVMRELEVLYNSFPKFVSKQHWADLYNDRVYNAIYLNEISTGSKYALKGIKLAYKGGPTWIQLYKNYFLLSMHGGNYSIAENIQSDILSRDAFKNLMLPIQEEWQIYAGYSYFAQQAFLGNLLDQKFKIKKIINELEFLKANKEGLNAAILILEVLINFLRHDYEAIVSRMEGLQQYKRRNFKIEETTRCRIFIDLIEVTVKKSFAFKPTIIAAEPHLKKLNESPRGAKGNIENLEIIPFERLWEWITERIKED